ncbi:Creatinase/Aminopeptidase P [Cladochytrium replicatum]|nr:Creatinase/Aminopeptidase P [Cladochytrium replicatum]
MDFLEPETIVLVPGFGLRYMSISISYPFHQNSNFRYLTGFNEPDAFLVLCKTSKAKSQGSDQWGYKTILFVKHRNRHTELWDDPRAYGAIAPSFAPLASAHPHALAIAPPYFPISSILRPLQCRLGCLFYHTVFLLPHCKLSLNLTFQNVCVLITNLNQHTGIHPWSQ